MTLPTGRPGQALAVALLLGLVGLGWVVVGAPLLDWYAERAAALDGRRALAARMVQVAASLPALQQQPAVAAPVAVPVLDGATDAVAGAQLQQLVQAMAVQAGTPLTSAEVLTAEAAGSYRRIGLRIAVNASWPVLIRLLDAIAGANPAMVVDDVQIRGGRGFIRDGSMPLDASWTVIAFRAGGA